MDDARVVRRFEPAGDLPADVERFANPKSTASQALSERLPRNELHDEKGMILVLLEAVQRGNVRMIERGEDAGLSFETSQSFGIARNLVGQHLDRDLAPERSIARAIDVAHASCAKEGEDLVATNRPSHPRRRSV